jgi:tetratricopeptide (TPR) repeat protein
VGKSELLLKLAIFPEKPLLVLDLDLPVEPAVRGALVGLLDPEAMGRGGLAEQAPHLEFFLRAATPLILLDHADTCRGQVEALLPALAEAAPGARFVVACREPFPWAGASLVALEPLEIPASPGDDPAFALLLAFCDEGRRAAILARRRPLRTLAQRLGGLPQRLCLAAPALAELEPESVLERLPAGSSGEALFSLAWSVLPEPLRAALCQVVAFSGGVDAGLFSAAHGDPAALRELARRGWLRSLLVPGPPRWGLAQDTFDWLASRADVVLQMPVYCTNQIEAICSRVQQLRFPGEQAIQQTATEQRNLWIAHRRLGPAPALDLQQALAQTWILGGLLRSHRCFPLSREQLDAVDRLLHGLRALCDGSALRPLLDWLWQEQAFQFTLDGQEDAALLLFAELLHRAPQGSFLWAMLSMQTASIHERRLALEEAASLLREATSTIPASEPLFREFLRSSSLILLRLGDAERVLVLMERLRSTYTAGQVPPREVQLWITAQIALTCNDLDAIRQAEAALLADDVRSMDPGVTLMFSAVVSLLSSAPIPAISRCQEARAAFRAPAQAATLVFLTGLEALAHLLAGDTNQARALLRETLAWLPSFHLLSRCLFLGALALTEVLDGRDERAAVLLGELRLLAAPLDASQEIFEQLSEAVGLVRGEPPQPRPIPGGPGCLQVLLARLLLRWQRDEVVRKENLVRIARDGTWLRGADGQLVSLASRPILCSLISALCEARLRNPGVALCKAELVQRAWPAERRPDGPAATNRLHVALATLRKSGLSSVLRSSVDGWFLAPELTRIQEPGAGEA